MKLGVFASLTICTALLTACGDESSSEREAPPSVFGGDSYDMAAQPVFKELGDWDGICEEEKLQAFLDKHNLPDFQFIDISQDGCQVSAFCGEGVCGYTENPATSYCHSYPVGSVFEEDVGWTNWRVKICEPGEEFYVPEQFREAHMPGGPLHYIDGKIGNNR